MTFKKGDVVKYSPERSTEEYICVYITNNLSLDMYSYLVTKHAWIEYPSCITARNYLALRTKKTTIIGNIDMQISELYNKAVVAKNAQRNGKVHDEHIFREVRATIIKLIPEEFI